MKTNKIKNTLIIIIFTLIVISGGIFYLYYSNRPCTVPITYSIGQFDTKFGISKQDFVSTLEDAQKVWENQLGKPLFQYEDTGGVMKINLIYDYRQNATDQLGNISDSIDENKKNYDQIKSKYDSLKSEYSTKDQAYTTESQDYDNDKSDYEKKVTYWNNNGGASGSTYNDLIVQGKQLDSRAKQLNLDARNINSLINEVNTTADTLNSMATELNLDVSTYNTVGSSTGEEFNEGEYVTDNTGRRINVYQFKSKAELERLLMHEFGHALGLAHVADPNAIMYKLNSSTNDKLTQDDINELNSVCNEKFSFSSL